jgi:hypothetical protein
MSQCSQCRHFALIVEPIADAEGACLLWMDPANRDTPSCPWIAPKEGQVPRSEPPAA